MPSLILTLVGPDRPGLVNTIANHVAAAGGSWLESRMARLAGQFAGIVRLDVAGRETIAGVLAALEAEGFHVAIQTTAPAARGDAATPAEIALLGQDRPGIVRDVTEALAALDVNIEELTTNVESGSFSGEAMFRATVRVRIPGPHGIDDVRTALEHLGHEFMVDVTANQGEPATA